MKKYLLLTIAALFFAVSCGEDKGTPVEYAQICDKSNDKKYVEATGFLSGSGFTLCSKHGNEPMRCPVEFKESPSSDKIPIRAYIDRGSGASSIEAEKDQPLKIRDAKSETVDASQKVKIVAEVDVFDEGTLTADSKSAACFVTVKKIEKAQ